MSSDFLSQAIRYFVQQTPASLDERPAVLMATLSFAGVA
jgi:hypothetical protein